MSLPERPALPHAKRASRRLWIVLSCLLLVVGPGCNGAEEAAPTEAAPAVASALVFTDATAEAGLGAFRHVTGAFGEKWFPETMGAGGAWLDYDGDGWLDLLLAGGGTWPGHGPPSTPALRLYRNNGDATFTEKTAEAGFEDLRAYGFGVTAADYDNDGDADVFVTTLYQNLLLRNDGGTFSEVGKDAGLADASEWSSAALFFDADRDGWLDLFVGNYVDWSPEKDVYCTVEGQIKSYCTPELYEGLSGRFYRNNGDPGSGPGQGPTFTEQTLQAGLDGAPGKTLAVAEGDFNGDGWSDFVVANDTQRDLLYLNRGDGTFDEQGVLSGIAFDENGRARAGMGIDVGDLENDGRPSILVGNFAKEMIGVYRYIGNGLFVDRAAVSRIGQPSLLRLTFGVFLFDADLDGDLDLFAANGHITEDIERVEDGITYRQAAQLFLNRGDGTFDEAPDALPATPMVARGTAYADYDRDGDLDVLVTENGGPVHLWRNDLPGGSFLRVGLSGRQSNRDALGARLVALVGGARMTRRIRTGSSYLSQSEKTATFGLGAAAQVDSLWIYWPGGRVDAFASVVARQEIHLVEGEGVYEAAALEQKNVVMQR